MSMKSVFVGSSESYSGKSAICLGLGLRLMDNGYKVGYMKPIGNILVDVDGVQVDEDTRRIKNVLGLKDPLHLMSPVSLTQQLIHDTLVNKQKKLDSRIKDAFTRISKNKDVMILEGIGDITGGAMFGLSCPEIARLTKSKIMLVSKYDSEYVVDRILREVRIIGDASMIAGVIFNDVPPHDMLKVNNLIKPFLENRGVSVLGVLPKDKILKSVTVKEVVEKLDGKILAGEKNKGNLIGSFCIGAMSPHNALKYFRRVTDALVITGGDRSDIQMAALEAGTKCLLLTGNLYPSDQVLVRAEELGVPVVIVTHDTLTTVQMIDNFVRRIHITEGRKLEKFREILEENVDFDELYRKTGITAGKKK